MPPCASTAPADAVVAAPGIRVEAPPALDLTSVMEHNEGEGHPVRMRPIDRGVIMRKPFVLDVSEWINSEPIDVASLRGKVVVVEAFQMLCPGCVTHSLPQAKMIRKLFSPDQVAVIGLHTVFEHHEVMTPKALRVFASEFGLTFPIAIDRPRGHGLPATMAHYDLQGTPSTLLVDRQGIVRNIAFGQINDMAMGAVVAELVAETVSESVPS